MISFRRHDQHSKGKEVMDEMILPLPFSKAPQVRADANK